MARRSVTVYRSRPRTAAPIIRVSAPAPVSRARRAGRIVRRAAGYAGSAALAEKHTLTALAAAFIIGHLEKQGTEIPTIGGLSPITSVGVIAWGIGKFGHNKMAAHMATGLLSISAYNMGRGAETTHGVAGRAYAY